MVRILVDVSETDDKRHRGDLDLFILALIDNGLSTPYDLQKSAGLSPGATVPALQRLIVQKWVIAGKPGIRGRTEHKITPEGRRYLKGTWKLLIDDGPSGDLDADVRVALLALWVGRDRRIAVSFLRATADKIQTACKSKEPDDPTSHVPLADWYRRLRSASSEALLRGESAAALAIAKALPRVPRAPRAKPKQ
jgi:DNA-binding PadR family transcriptional regulator